MSSVPFRKLTPRTATHTDLEADTPSSPQVATPPSTLSGRKRKTSGQSSKGGDPEELSVSEGEGGGAKDEELCGTSANQINEQMQRVLNQLYASVPFVGHQGAFELAGLTLCVFLQEGVRVRGRLRQSGLGGDGGDSAAVGGLPRILAGSGQPGGGTCRLFGCFCVSATDRAAGLLKRFRFFPAASGGIHRGGDQRHGVSVQIQGEGVPGDHRPDRGEGSSVSHESPCDCFCGLMNSECRCFDKVN